MDSGNNSGSMQSSSSGDEQSYDSRAESSISAFFNSQQQPPNHVGLFSATNLQNSHPQNHHNNPHPYLNPIQRIAPSLPHTNSLLNLDTMWFKPPRSQPNQNHLEGLMPCSSLPSPQNQAFLSSQLTRGNNNDQATHHHTLLPSESNDQAHNNNSNSNNSNVVRNPKKRSRASRREPTTVLTTDTTNFRAMVQEFTGIPAPPFTSSPFPRTRLDLFAPSATSTVRSTYLDPPYLLRPFAQKLGHHPFPPSTSSSLPPSSPMVDTLSASFNNPTNSTSINYQLPLNNFNQSSNLSQTILQAPPNKYPFANSSIPVSKTQLPSLEIPPSATDSHLKMGVFEFEELRHGHVNTDLSCLHQNTVSVGVGALSSGNNNNLSNASTEWAQRTGTITNNDCDNGEGALRSLSGTVNYSNNIEERVTNGKANYSVSALDFHGEKGPECEVPARSQVMVESWINCSSH